MANLTVDMPASDLQWEIYDRTPSVIAIGTVLSSSVAAGLSGWLVEANTREVVATGKLLRFAPRSSPEIYWSLLFDLSGIRAIDECDEYDLYAASFRADSINSAAYDEVISVRRIRFVRAFKVAEVDQIKGAVGAAEPLVAPIYDQTKANGSGHLVMGHYLQNDTVSTVRLVRGEYDKTVMAENYSSLTGVASATNHWEAFFPDLVSGYEYASTIITASGSRISPRIAVP